MKVVTVSFSAIQRHKRLDAGFYCGTLGQEHRAEIEKRKTEVARQQAEITAAEARETAANEQHRQRVAAGEVKPI